MQRHQNAFTVKYTAKRLNIIYTVNNRTYYLIIPSRMKWEGNSVFSDYAFRLSLMRLRWWSGHFCVSDVVKCIRSFSCGKLCENCSCKVSSLSEKLKQRTWWLAIKTIQSQWTLCPLSLEKELRSCCLFQGIDKASSMSHHRWLYDVWLIQQMIIVGVVLPEKIENREKRVWNQIEMKYDIRQLYIYIDL